MLSKLSTRMDHYVSSRLTPEFKRSWGVADVSRRDHRTDSERSVADVRQNSHQARHLSTLPSRKLFATHWQGETGKLFEPGETQPLQLAHIPHSRQRL